MWSRLYDVAAAMATLRDKVTAMATPQDKADIYLRCLAGENPQFNLEYIGGANVSLVIRDLVTTLNTTDLPIKNVGEIIIRWAMIRYTPYDRNKLFRSNPSCYNCADEALEEFIKDIEQRKPLVLKQIINYIVTKLSTYELQDARYDFRGQTINYLLQRDIIPRYRVIIPELFDGLRNIIQQAIPKGVCPINSIRLMEELAKTVSKLVNPALVVREKVEQCFNVLLDFLQSFQVTTKPSAIRNAFIGEALQSLDSVVDVLVDVYRVPPQSIIDKLTTIFWGQVNDKFSRWDCFNRMMDGLRKATTFAAASSATATAGAESERSVAPRP